MPVPAKALCLFLLLAAILIGFSQSRPQQLTSGEGYIDSATCSACHAGIAGTYAQTAMGRSFQSVQPDSMLAEFAGNTIQHRASDQFFTPLKSDTKYLVRRHQSSNTNTLQSQVDFVLGSGNHARSYLHRTPDGTLTMMPVSWYTDKGWAMSPAFDRPDHPGFNRIITYRCLFCHTGYPEIVPGSDMLESAAALPGRIPNGIDCQRCHGPGAKHVELAQHGAPSTQLKAAIVNPARLTSTRQMEVCMQCHLETTSHDLPPAVMRQGRGVFSYRPGEPLENYIQHFDHAPNTGNDDKFELVSAAYRLRQSQCFLAGAGAMTCSTCHNPHQTPSKTDAPEHFAKACQSCHASIATSKNHPARGDCATCHMPKRRPSDATRIVITDHLIRKTPANFPDPAHEDHSANIPIYTGRVAAYYPATSDSLTLAIAQVRQQSNLVEGLKVLTALVEANRPASGGPDYEIAEAWLNAARPDKAIPYYRKAIAKQPAQWHFHVGLGTALAAVGQLQPALEAHLAARAIAPNEVAVLYSIADIYLRQSKWLAARAAIDQAIALNPERPEGYNNLGVLLLNTGDITGAVKALKEALRLQPESAATHGNLARAYTRQGNALEAKNQFVQAANIGPSHDQARAAYNAEFLATEDRIKAQAKYAQSLNLQRADAYLNLGMAWMVLGNGEEGKRNFKLALAADPQSAMANLNLGAALASEKQFTEAAAYLQKAAQSADPLLSGSARTLLAKLPK